MSDPDQQQKEAERNAALCKGIVVETKGSQPHPGGHPARGSLWEVYPITDIQVCKNKTLNECSPQDRTVWAPLHELPAHMMGLEAVSEMKSEPDED
jgi:hypothetical protein